MQQNPDASVRPKRGRPAKKKDPIIHVVSGIPDVDIKGDAPSVEQSVSEDTQPEDVQVVAVRGSSRQKRRRLSPPESIDDLLSGPEQRHQHPQDAARQATYLEWQAPNRTAVDVSLGSPSASSTPKPPEAAATSKPTPSPRKSRKPLKLNGTGGFGTPEDRKAVLKDDEVRDGQVSSPKRGRRKKTKAQLILILRYGGDDRKHRFTVGGKIDAILATPRPVPGIIEGPPILKSAVNPSKSAHPFFSAKAKRADLSKGTTKSISASAATSTTEPARPPTAFSTPGKLKALRLAQFAPLAAEEPYVETRSSRLYKVPGAVDPAWPPRSAAHVVLHEQTRSTKPSYAPSTSTYHLSLIHI